MNERVALEAGTLMPRVKEQTAHALGCGAMQSILTEHRFLSQGGVRFIVRSVSNLARKQAARQVQTEAISKSDRNFDPFLPYDENLFVAAIFDTHLCLLNKFNVVDHHLLIVTRDFEDQDTLLTAEDFRALWACMAEIPGLAFYNGGKAAGASQRHKHLQLIELPLAPEGPSIPIEPVLASAKFSGPLGNLPALPFKHSFTRLDPSALQSPDDAGKRLWKRYHAMLAALKLLPHPPDTRQKRAYNLLITREWMLLVPRSEECFGPISINALGFAGALLVRDEHQMALIQQHGPMTALSEVAIAI